MKILALHLRSQVCYCYYGNSLWAPTLGFLWPGWTCYCCLCLVRFHTYIFKLLSGCKVRESVKGIRPCHLRPADLEASSGPSSLGRVALHLLLVSKVGSAGAVLVWWEHVGVSSSSRQQVWVHVGCPALWAHRRLPSCAKQTDRQTNAWGRRWWLLWKSKVLKNSYREFFKRMKK